MRMHMPMNSLPLLKDFSLDGDAKTPLTVGLHLLPGKKTLI